MFPKVAHTVMEICDTSSISKELRSLRSQCHKITFYSQRFTFVFRLAEHYQKIDFGEKFSETPGERK